MGHPIGVFIQQIFFHLTAGLTYDTIIEKDVRQVSYENKDRSYGL